MLLLALTLTEATLDACSSLELASANATGTGSVPVESQTLAEESIATEIESELHHRGLRESDVGPIKRGEFGLARKHFADAGLRSTASSAPAAWCSRGKLLDRKQAG